ncbi:MAG: 2-hydroxyglutaryl-CoA dehydratase [Candidatus Coatesbacteria bacterium]|nr:2-hydroxyglutaryl-CoA dehydratase [Candidatus Coatesbacteria bacterium]
MKSLYIGVDAGSITAKSVAIDESGVVAAHAYLRNSGDAIGAILTALREMGRQLCGDVRVLGAGATGSARELAAALVGADIVKNEITAHAIATLKTVPEARTIIEIGGQESKLIILEGGAVVDFRLNSICAAGTGSFLDHQADRMGISVLELGELAANAPSRARISGQCTVFAETDLILKQQMGYGRDEICAGLCDALADSYLSNVAKGKSLKPPIVFQGGVAANAGMRRAFERRLEADVVVPRRHALMGAIGVAVLAQRLRDWDASRFKGFDLAANVRRGDSFLCDGCDNRCEVVRLVSNGELVAYLGSRCGKW